MLLQSPPPPPHTRQRPAGVHVHGYKTPRKNGRGGCVGGGEGVGHRYTHWENVSVTGRLCQWSDVAGVGWIRIDMSALVAHEIGQSVVRLLPQKIGHGDPLLDDHLHGSPLHDDHLRLISKQLRAVQRNLRTKQRVLLQVRAWVVPRNHMKTICNTWKLSTLRFNSQHLH